MRLIMLGAPGAGKGTQAKKLAAKYDIPHISTGDIFRANIKNETELGHKAKEYMDQGLLVPDSLTLELVADRLSQADAQNGFVLDGFPRTIPQATNLDETLTAMDSPIDAALNIHVEDDVIIKRMSGRRACEKCGATYHIINNPPQEEGVCDICGGKLVLRKDDEPETVQKRLQVYHDQTQPLIDFYEAKGLLKTVDGTMPIDVIFDTVVDILGE